MINTIAKRNIIIVELFMIMLLYGVMMWVLLPMIFTSSVSLYIFLILSASVVVYYFHISPLFIHKDTFEARGLGQRKSFFIRIDNFFEALNLVFFPLIIISAVIVLLAWYKDSNFFSEPDWYGLFYRFLVYLLSAFVQDIFFFSLILIRLKQIIVLKSDLHKLIIVTLVFAVIFSIFHLPNTPLMALSFIFAFCLGCLFYKVPNLYVVVLVHAVLGTLLHLVYKMHMKVGIFYGFEGNVVMTYILK